MMEKTPQEILQKFETLLVKGEIFANKRNFLKKWFQIKSDPELKSQINDLSSFKFLLYTHEGRLDKNGVVNFCPHSSALSHTADS